ncbi:MAG: CCE_0567 family metalloprotein [Methylotenera sp.]|uniref:CCE_0567 family metalloprotein n=1 Tax=Methylotenera sp. TaxID=2051956 RepID=UPI002489CA7A|nr:CCE_0567 family metalloprotein [Methylotenera sp.]MDI1310411.1 CCE_0567 family metalloprotein [Methylotenera sp.]
MTEVEAIDAIKAEIKKLNGQATQLKMDLHDLSEDLPIGWEKIPEIAEKTFNAYEQLTSARKRLAGVGG